MKLNSKLYIVQFALAALFIGIATFCTQAQTVVKPAPTPAPCPSVYASGDESIVVKEDATFSANVSGGDSNIIPTFNWTISAGTISSGQGTSSITVDTTKLKVGETITATIDVGGFDRSCSTSNSVSTSVVKKP